MWMHETAVAPSALPPYARLSGPGVLPCEVLLRQLPVAVSTWLRRWLSQPMLRLLFAAVRCLGVQANGTNRCCPFYVLYGNHVSHTH